MEKIVDTFKLSLQENIKNISANLLELSIDALLDNEVIKSIPIVQSIRHMYGMVTSIQKINLVKQIVTFINNVNKGIATQKEKDIFLKKLNNKKELNKILELLLYLLERNIEKEKSIIYAKIFTNYIKEYISYNDLLELMMINDSVFLSDIDSVITIYKNPKNSENCSMSSLGRISSLGLGYLADVVDNETLYLNSKNFKLTDIGKKFVEIITV